MVKNDALFSYIAPSNIFAWLLMPLRYCMPLKQFVWLNRTVIKVTHCPVLVCIYLYERLWLAHTIFEPTDLIDHPGRGRERSLSFIDPAHKNSVFSPNVRVREESVAGFHKDRALEEVFRRAPEATTLRTHRRNERHKAQTAIRNWMDQHDAEGGLATNWPTLDSRAMPEWQRRLSTGWDRPSNLRQVSEVRSTASDPADLLSNVGGLAAMPKRTSRPELVPTASEYKGHTDADGDDELHTNDEEEEEDHPRADAEEKRFGDHLAPPAEENEDYFMTPMTSRIGKLASSHSSSQGLLATPRSPPQKRPRKHNRTLSSNTILFNPESSKRQPSSSSASPGRSGQGGVGGGGRTSGRSAGDKTPARRSSPQRTSPKRIAQPPGAKPRPMMPPRGLTDTGGVSRSALLSVDPRKRLRDSRRLSSVDLSILSDNTSARFPNDDHTAGSFQTQMIMNQRRTAGGGDSADRDRMGRLVLARMKTLEEGFSEIIKEMRAMKDRSAPTSRRNSAEDLRTAQGLPGKKTRGDVTPKKVANKRPMSRRSMKESKPPVDFKGKGKQLTYSSDDEAEADVGFTQKGSSL